jgi:hypothetical protein
LLESKGILKKNINLIGRIIMKRLALIAVTGVLALALTACGGEKDNKPAAGTDNAAAQPAQNQPAGTTQAPEGQNH